MKKVDLNSKQFGVWVKGVTVLSLFLGLQGFVKCKGGTAGHMATKMDSKKFSEEIENLKDISILDEKDRSKLYSAVKYNQPEKVQIILKRYDKDMASRFPHKNPDFINTRDPISNNTPLEETIIQGNSPIFNTLAKNQYINIKTIHPTSSNTLLHFAIKNKRIGIAKNLIDRLKDRSARFII